MVMMSQWEIAITKMEERFQQVETMVEDLKKIHAEAQATRDDMNYFLSLVKIPSEHGKEEEVSDPVVVSSRELGQPQPGTEGGDGGLFG